LDNGRKLLNTGGYSRHCEQQREDGGVVREDREAVRLESNAECLDYGRSEDYAANVPMNLHAEATIGAVGANVEAKYTASRPAVNTVVVIGKCTLAGWTGDIVVDHCWASCVSRSKGAMGIEV
jgi:hypothetical protein